MSRNRPEIEALKTALLMEETGQVFYDSLAAATGNPAAAALFQRLSEEEVRHRRTFQRMLEAEQSGGSGWDEAGEEPIREWVKAAILPDPDAIQEVAIRGSARDALELAVGMEDRAVAFYGLLLESAPGGDRGTIREIVREEEDHAKVLRKLLLDAGERPAQDPGRPDGDPEED